MLSRYLPAILYTVSAMAHATTLHITNDEDKPLSRVMVTQTQIDKVVADLSDEGYAQEGVLTPADTTITRFTNAAGTVSFKYKKY